MTQQLTKKQALEQGYELCGYADKEWQSLMHIKNINDVDFEDEQHHGKIVLADKKGNSPIVDEESIKDIVAEYALDMHTQENQDDTNEVYDLVKEVDFSEIVKTINDKLSAKKYYKLTNIILLNL